jgi:hypothetical protein
MVAFNDLFLFQNLEVAIDLVVGAVDSAHQVHDVGLSHCRQGGDDLLSTRRRHQSRQVQQQAPETQRDFLPYKQEDATDARELERNEEK